MGEDAEALDRQVERIERSLREAGIDGMAARDNLAWTLINAELRRVAFLTLAGRGEATVLQCRGVAVRGVEAARIEEIAHDPDDAVISRVAEAARRFLRPA